MIVGNFNDFSGEHKNLRVSEDNSAFALNGPKKLQKRTAIVGIVYRLILLIVLLILDDSIGYIAELFRNHLGPLLTVDLNFWAGVEFDRHTAGRFLQTVCNQPCYFLLIVTRNQSF